MNPRGVPLAAKCGGAHPSRGNTQGLRESQQSDKDAAGTFLLLFQGWRPPQGHTLRPAGPLGTDRSRPPTSVSTMVALVSWGHCHTTATSGFEQPEFTFSLLWRPGVGRRGVAGPRCPCNGQGSLFTTSECGCHWRSLVPLGCGCHPGLPLPTAVTQSSPRLPSVHPSLCPNFSKDPAVLGNGPPMTPSALDFLCKDPEVTCGGADVRTPTSFGGGHNSTHNSCAG